MAWKRLRFDVFLTRVDRRVIVDDAAEYSTVGVRLNGRGAYVRESLRGSEIARKQQWTIQSGDVVYNKLFAWRGSFALADQKVDGLLVSDKFPTYRLDPDLVEPAYLGYFFRTRDIASQARAMSKGAAALSKLTLNPPQFWDLTIPVPDSIVAQREIAERVRQVEGIVMEADALRLQLELAQRALRSGVIAEQLGGARAEGHLSDVLRERPRNGWSPRCDNAGGVSVLGLSAVTGYAYRPEEAKTTSEPTDASAHYWLEPGDLLITRSNTPELVGQAAIYDGTPSPCIYPDLMMRLRLRHDLADTRFVHYWLQSRPVRDYIRRSSRGTSPTMKKIAQGDVERIPFPTGIDVEEQRRLVVRLDAVLDKLAKAGTTTDEIRERIGAIMPTLLRQAFAGEGWGMTAS